MFQAIIVIFNAISQDNCDMFDYVPIDSDHCPHVDYLANLKTCEEANDNELCFSKGICELKTNLNNCLYPTRDIHTYDIYAKHSKYRQLSYWEELGVSEEYWNLVSDVKPDDIFYCSDNYLIHETSLDNPVFEVKITYPLKTLSECQNECINSALDSKNRRCEAYGWKTNGKLYTETTLNECKYFYKCELKETKVYSEISKIQTGRYIDKSKYCKPGHPHPIDKIWSTGRNYHWYGTGRWSELGGCSPCTSEQCGGCAYYHIERKDVFVFPDYSWCPKLSNLDDEIVLNPDWIIFKGYFVNYKNTETKTSTQKIKTKILFTTEKKDNNPKSKNNNVLTSQKTTLQKTTSQKETSQKTTSQKTTSPKTILPKTTSPKTPSQKETSPKTPSQKTTSTTSIKNLINKTYNVYNNNKHKTTKVLLLSIIAILIIIPSIILTYYKCIKKSDSSTIPPDNEREPPAYENPVYTIPVYTIPNYRNEQKV